ncbi:hypothetical protein NDU88_003619 [Pleurodeles waltl]|uniref:F-box domain-containing protein n=1 Tax=Pleurodeles waltl TaxID=8319 RepID=A0AAV7W2P7_PLEWA|nr:hypothetical protein NDU88_003619 [Pleurodeles waltl]
MGQLLCRSPDRSSASSGRGRNCLFRGPCMLCFLVQRTEEPPPAHSRPLLSAAVTGGEMVCKRRGAGLPAATPRKQPRGADDWYTEEQCEGSSLGAPNDSSLEGAVPNSLHIHQLPPSILLKIFSNLSLNERCLSASLVCKYWRDLCLDFQFWKQLDLSSRQQVTDDVLEKIASRNPNLSEINISDCRKVSDTGLRLLALNCPGLLKYTAYRCKQLSDASLTAVASHCPLLNKVHLGNQDQLTDEGLKQIVPGRWAEMGVSRSTS